MNGRSNVLKISKTEDYDSFHRVNGNRSINSTHLKRLKNEIAKQDLLFMNPILVNKRKEIIDGQHRLQAARELNKTVYYITIINQTQKKILGDIHTLNQNRRNWSVEQFMHSYCDLGKPDYRRYYSFKERWGLQHSECIMLLSSKGKTPSGGRTYNKFKNNTNPCNIIFGSIRVPLFQKSF